VRRLGLRTFREYCRVVESQPEQELDELINAITTNLTSFFRENHHFEYLRNKLLPELVKNVSGREITVWSAGCSTGEEPYSLAMTLRESLPAYTRAKIIATDIDSNVLAAAAQGVYTQERVNGIDRVRMQRWFQRGTGPNAGKVRAKRELRDLIEFSQLNLMHERWHVPSPVDFIFCRNVLIYFDRETKQRLAERYAKMLPIGGHLFIGHSESLFRVCEQFELIGNTIYRRVR
jgi:chemotaxis protein methyltransferase CheR